MTENTVLYSLSLVKKRDIMTTEEELAAYLYRIIKENDDATTENEPKAIQPDLPAWQENQPQEHTS